MSQILSSGPRLQDIRKHLETRGFSKPVESLREFIDVVKAITDRWQEEDWRRIETNDEYLLNSARIVGQVWFRGHSTPNLSLRPGLYRESTFNNLKKLDNSPTPSDSKNILIDELFDLELDLRIDFTSYGRLLNPANEAKSSADWYFLMQHHGAPTRLLDWTTNALASLFFCVQEHQPSRERSTSANVPKKAKIAIWMLDAYWLADRLSDTWFAPLLAWSADADRYIPPLEALIDKREDTRALFPTHAMPIEPPALHPRVAAQEGRFIIFGQTMDLLDERIRLKPLASGKELEELRLHQIQFEVADIDALLRELAQLGISRRTLFPDLAGLADFVTWKHFHKVCGFGPSAPQSKKTKQSKRPALRTAKAR